MLVVDEGTENVLELAATGQFQVDDDGTDDNDNESYTTDEDDVNEVQVEKSQRRDMIAYATRWTKELINDPTAARVVRDGNADQSEYALATKYDASRKLVQRGFGRRSRHDLKMGMSNAAAFRIPIAELFRDEGSDKQHPSWVLERLAEMDANMYRLDMPTESDVRKVLQRCIRWKMKALKANTPEPDYVELMRSVNDPIDSTYSQFIDAEIERDPLQSPKSFLVSWPSGYFHTSCLMNAFASYSISRKTRENFQSLQVYNFFYFSLKRKVKEEFSFYRKSFTDTRFPLTVHATVQQETYTPTQAYPEPSYSHQSLTMLTPSKAPLVSALA